MKVVEVKSPDGWVCEVVQNPEGGFSPVRWRDGHEAPPGANPVSDPSPGLREHAFASAKEAMMAAWRERLHRDYLRRNLTPKPSGK